MILSGARALVRASQNPTCEVLLSMVLEGVREVEFYGHVTGHPYPGEYGERPAAWKRGSMFEANLHRNDAYWLRRAVGSRYDLDPVDMSVLNLDDETLGQDWWVRLERTRQVLAALAAGKPVPDLVIQPQLVLPVGEDYSVAIKPDFLILDRHVQMYKAGEEKSFIVRAGVAAKPDLVGTRLQAAVEIEALRAEASRVGLAERVSNHAVFVFATPYGLQPSPAFEESLDGAVYEIRRAIRALQLFKPRLDALQGVDHCHRHLAGLIERLPFNFQEHCIGTCILATVCFAKVADQARSLGDAAAEYLGADMSLARVEALLLGAAPVDPIEEEIADNLIAAVHMLGFDVQALRKRHD